MAGMALALGERTLPRRVTDHPWEPCCFQMDSLPRCRQRFALQQLKGAEADGNLRR